MDTTTDATMASLRTDCITTTNISTTLSANGICTTETVNDTTMRSSDMEFRKYTEYQVARWLLLVYRPTCAVCGVAGNTLCVIVVMTTSLRHSPTAVYIVTLAVLDWILSVFALLTAFAKDAFFGEELYFRETWHCRVHYFFLLFIAHFDTLTLMCMTAQRYVAVRFPLHAALWNTRRGASLTLFLAAAVAFFANVVHLVTFHVQPYNGQYRGRCDVGSGLGEYVQMRVYPWIDSVLYFLLPTVVITVLNVLMYYALRSSGQFKGVSASRGQHQKQFVSRYSDGDVPVLSENTVMSSLTSVTTISNGMISPSSVTDDVTGSGSPKQYRNGLSRANTVSCRRELNQLSPTAPSTQVNLGRGGFKWTKSGVGRNGAKWLKESSVTAAEFQLFEASDSLQKNETESSDRKLHDAVAARPNQSRLDHLLPTAEGMINCQETQLSGMYNEVTNGKSRRQTPDDLVFTAEGRYGLETSFSPCNNSSSSTQLSGGCKEAKLSNSSKLGKTAHSSQLTRMLLTVSAAFLVLTLPIGVFVVVSRYWNPPSGYEKALFNLFRDITESLMYTNHAINFVLYCLAGRRFRAKVMSIVCRTCRSTRRAENDVKVGHDRNRT